MSQPVQLTPNLRVALLWLLVGALFVMFNLAYWPLHTMQQETAPENFLAYAQKHHVQGDSERGLAILRQGIHELRPPYAEPYTMLAAWLHESGNALAASEYVPLARFYSALELSGAARQTAFAEAVRLTQLQLNLPPVQGSAVNAVWTLARDAGTAQGLLESIEGQSTGFQLAYLHLLGTAIQMDGEVGATGTRLPVELLVQSTGGTGPVLPVHILAGGKEFAHQRRGFSVALLDPEDGQVFQSGHFDTWESAEHAVRMAAMLDDAPAGTVGAFAVRDDGAANLTPALRLALEGFGFAAQANIRRAPALLGIRYSFAGIGVKGAAPGTALQTWSPSLMNGYAGHTVVCGVFPAAEAAP